MRSAGDPILHWLLQCRISRDEIRAGTAQVQTQCGPDIGRGGCPLHPVARGIGHAHRVRVLMGHRHREVVARHAGLSRPEHPVFDLS
jgi:hypothetical protein